MFVILRKPYAFLVKHFKLIHSILTLIIAFLVYRTNAILSFLNEYLASSQTSVIDNLTNTIFSLWMFLLPFFIIVISMIIISLMSVKKKPITFYLFNIVVAIAILVLYNFSYSMFTQMEATILEVRTVRLFRDIIMILELSQFVTLILVLIRAVGFDLKKFNFGQDLQELEIEETDNEEVEINIEIDTNKVHRKVNRIRRFTKYIYYENKFLIDVGVLIGISVICFFIYMSLGIYEREVEEGKIFSTTSFYLGVTRSYITNQDYKGNLLDNDNMLIVLEIKIRSKGKPKKLDTGMVNIKMENQTFYPIEIYKDDIMDFGHNYLDTEIPTSFEKHLLVFKVPKYLVDEKITFTYTDKIDYISQGINSKYIKLKLNPTKIDERAKKQNINLNEELNFKTSIFKESKLKIEKVEIQKEFRENYQFCVTAIECFLSAEIIFPTYNSNENKAILKITGTLKKDDDIVLDRVYSLYHLIYYFSTLRYEKEGKEITQKVTMNQVKPSKFTPKNTYYIEVSEDIMSADKIWLDFHVRNRDYRYQIK